MVPGAVRAMANKVTISLSQHRQIWILARRFDNTIRWSFVLNGSQQAGSYVPHAAALTCRFGMGESVRGSGAAAPGRCRRSFFQDRQPTRIRSAPTLPRKDLSGSASSPEPVFSAPALGTAGGARLSDRGPSSRQECSLLDNVRRKRREWVQEG